MYEDSSKALERVWGQLSPYMDILLNRPEGGVRPEWVRSRGWSEGLALLDDAQLQRAEALGLSRIASECALLHPELLALCKEIETIIDPMRGIETPLPDHQTYGVRARKRPQVAALMKLCRARWPSPRRVVDLGSGHGHLSRALFDALNVPVVGLEHVPALVHRANVLSGPERARFEVADAAREAGLCAGDLAVGLHACGALGDSLIEQARAASAHVLLVSCCQQKRETSERRPLSALGTSLGLSIPTPILGLSNLAYWRAESKAVQVMDGRVVRHALAALLRSRGVALSPGDETRGLHRRHFRRGLSAVAAVALEARGLAGATEAELSCFGANASREHARNRRFSLPRNMLGRLLELSLVLDRACFLQEAGYEVQVLAAFSERHSPRNLAIVGRIG